MVEEDVWWSPLRFFSKLNPKQLTTLPKLVLFCLKSGHPWESPPKAQERYTGHLIWNMNVPIVPNVENFHFGAGSTKTLSEREHEGDGSGQIVIFGLSLQAFWPPLLFFFVWPKWHEAPRIDLPEVHRYHTPLFPVWQLLAPGGVLEVGVLPLCFLSEVLWHAVGVFTTANTMDY